MGIRFVEAKPLVEVGYSVSDWAGDVKGIKYVSFCAFVMAGGTVIWCARHKAIVATSACKAEYRAL